MGKRKRESGPVDELAAEQAVSESPPESPGSNGHVTTADFKSAIDELRSMVMGLAQNQQQMAKLLAPEDDLAPDDSDLREEAEQDAVALSDPKSGVAIVGLGKDDKKGKASEMLVDAMFNTPTGKLDEMTDIRNSLEAAAFAGVRTLNQFVLSAFRRKPTDPPMLMSDLFLDNLFKLNRSVGGKHLLRAMAMSQLEREKEESRENSIIFGGGE